MNLNLVPYNLFWFWLVNFKSLKNDSHWLINNFITGIEKVERWQTTEELKYGEVKIYSCSPYCFFSIFIFLYDYNLCNGTVLICIINIKTINFHINLRFINIKKIHHFFLISVLKLFNSWSAVILVSVKCNIILFRYYY